ncbi:MAG: Flp pilus assembly protein CpaB [Alphaproteobacteria bacterium]|nr:Flp pilus assembly protein CpaB [Alphaproteobacteria bacterium]MBU0794875.1 Flp pilus assembly protein CpaB [Alphaproteobacteria bacterium]MBU0875504.1 Flp pilus assembly protein CpaB [Alphaproteobacteria bacterium]MBU1771369.1 Flp pilus assembly protein CpaB [Alphaproteobacteria bacterium]
MEPKKIALLAGALIIAVAAAFLARSMFTSGGGAPQATASAMPDTSQMPHVLVATKSLPVGTIVGPDAYRFQPWPKELVEDAYYIQGKADENQMVGAVVRTAIAAGQPVTQGSLIKPGDRGFLAAALSPGMRAVTVPVSVQSSVAGFVFPGDRVDLVLTQNVPGGGDGPPLKVSETILRNLRVLATDQRTNALDETGQPVVRTYSNVTMEVTPRMAEKISVAQTVGALSLALRSLADNTQELEAALASGDIDAVDAENGGNTLITAARPIDGRSTYSTGADVSRYQRSTVPAKPIDPNGAPTGAGPMVRIARGAAVTNIELGSN